MPSLYRTVRENPLVAGALAALGLLVGCYTVAATIWSSIYIDRPFLPTVWERLRTVLPAGLLWLSISLTVVIVSACVLTVVTVSVIRKKPRLEGERLARELKGQSAVISQLTDERDSARAELKDERTEQAFSVFRQYANRAATEKLSNTATIRFARYGDDGNNILDGVVLLARQAGVVSLGLVFGLALLVFAFVWLNSLRAVKWEKFTTGIRTQSTSATEITSAWRDLSRILPWPKHVTEMNDSSNIDDGSISTVVLPLFVRERIDFGAEWILTSRRHERFNCCADGPSIGIGHVGDFYQVERCRGRAVVNHVEVNDKPDQIRGSSTTGIWNWCCTSLSGTPIGGIKPRLIEEPQRTVGSDGALLRGIRGAASSFSLHRESTQRPVSKATGPRGDENHSDVGQRFWAQPLVPVIRLLVGGVGLWCGDRWLMRGGRRNRQRGTLALFLGLAALFLGPW